MDRRKFIKTSIGFGSFAVAGCGSHIAKQSSQVSNIPRLTGDIQTFAYYQAFYGNQTIADLRPNGDGTTHNMPILKASDIYRGKEIIDQAFWHGHGQDHLFSILRADYAKLLQGETVYKFTTEVDNHWHCIKIAPSN